MVGSLLKGALVSFTAAGGALGLSSAPNVIVFQINPESITHAWTEATAPEASQDPKIKYSPLAVSGVPGESFTFTLMLDSDEQVTDAASDPVGAGLALASGVYTRLSALELLQFPAPSASGGLVGQVTAAAGAAASGAGATANATVPVSEVPVVLFVWGPQRIVPVRVTALSVTERLYDVALNPTHAEAQITLRVLTPDELAAVQGPMSGIANMAYSYNQGLREARAALNVAESAAGILGMLLTPF